MKGLQRQSAFSIWSLRKYPANTLLLKKKENKALKFQIDTLDKYLTEELCRRFIPASSSRFYIRSTLHNLGRPNTLCWQSATLQGHSCNNKAVLYGMAKPDLCTWNGPLQWKDSFASVIGDVHHLSIVSQRSHLFTQWDETVLPTSACNVGPALFCCTLCAYSLPYRQWDSQGWDHSPFISFAVQQEGRAILPLPPL